MSGAGEHDGAPDWAAVEQLFGDALDLPPAERDRLLAACADTAVRDEVARLLRRHDRLGASLDADPMRDLDLSRAMALVEPSEPPPGSAIGRYRVAGRLGRGSTGSVLLAEDAALGRTVAIKMLAPHLGVDSRAVERFREEARLAASLDHPNVATIHEIAETADARLYIVMAFYPGGSLRERLANGAMPLADALRVAAEVAAGLAATHAVGIVHRDVKPENILFGADGAARLADFGVAKVVGRQLTRTGATFGTVAYMSPEQTRGTAVDHRSDLWSLGVVLFELLTGRRPFEAPHGEALVYAIRHDPPARVETFRPDAPRWLTRLVARCLEKDPRRRPASAREVVGALSDGGRGATGGARTRATRGAAVALGALGVLATFLLLRTGGAGPEVVAAADVAPASLAVLPFADASESRDQLHLSESVGAELTSVLAAVPALRVTAYEAARPAAAESVRRIGERLGVAAVLRGTARRSGDVVRVRAELLRTSDGRQLWTAGYERSLGELGSLQRDIGRDVARALRRSPDADASPPAPTASRVDPVAYDLYMRGRLLLHRREPARLPEAAEYFREAIALDSSLARAYVGLADVYVASPGTSAERFRRARPLLDRALALDGSLAAAHRTAGWIAMWYDHDWGAARRHLERALALDPSDVWAHRTYAAYLAVVGRADSAFAVTRRATVLDPGSEATATHLGLGLYWLRRYDDAIAVLERALAADSTSVRLRPILGRAYLAAGRHDDAIAQFRRGGVQFASFEPEGLLAHALGVAGRRSAARRVVESLEVRARASYVAPANLMAAYLGLGDMERALAWAERIPADSGATFFPLVDPMFAPLLAEPRFVDVLARLDLEPPVRPAAPADAAGR